MKANGYVFIAPATQSAYIPPRQFRAGLVSKRAARLSAPRGDEPGRRLQSGKPRSARGHPLSKEARAVKTA